MISLSCVVFLLISQFGLNFALTSIPGRIIQTQYGPIQGREEFYDGIKSVYTYKGVRFAAPPVGNLRFRQAIPPTPWSEVFQADTHGSWCPQLDIQNGSYVGNEDCLFLNIATPKNQNSNNAVIVNFHGGGLHSGAADLDFFRADLINERGVIYVTPNYRLNTLGFLNSGDGSSPGNFGIKDMIFALQWVRNNIAAFGGDPNNVGIMGISGGGVGVNKKIFFITKSYQNIFRFTHLLFHVQLKVFSIKLFHIPAHFSILTHFHQIHKSQFKKLSKNFN